MTQMCQHCNLPKTVCGSYALMKEPANWRARLSGKTWVCPVGGQRLFVGGERSLNWERAAALDGRSARELIHFNFQTNDPLEVNWYLYHFVGCRYSSDGRRNLSFHYASPGIIYTRRRVSTQEPYISYQLEDVLISSYS